MATNLSLTKMNSILSNIFLLALIAVGIIKTPALNAQPVEVQGGETNGLKPFLSIERSRANWYVEIDFKAQTNFSEWAWLKISSRFGSKLELWQTNGVEIQPTNPVALANNHLPVQTTVSNILSGFHPANLRGLQWGRSGFNGTKVGEFFPLASFDLGSAFNVPFTNDIVLQITPLIYRVETNEVTAHLVEFPPIKVRLMADGNVRKEER